MRKAAKSTHLSSCTFAVTASVSSTDKDAASAGSDFGSAPPDFFCSFLFSFFFWFFVIAADLAAEVELAKLGEG